MQNAVNTRGNNGGYVFTRGGQDFQPEPVWTRISNIAAIMERILFLNATSQCVDGSAPEYSHRASKKQSLSLSVAPADRCDPKADPISQACSQQMADPINAMRTVSIDSVTGCRG